MSGVYFMQAGENGPIKIGHCQDIGSRRSTIQAHNHVQIEVLGYVEAGPTTEWRLHARFRKLKIRGEWFRFDGELRDFLSKFEKHQHYRGSAAARHRIKFRKGGEPFIEKITRYRHFTQRDKDFFREVLGRKAARVHIAKYDKNEIRRKKAA